MNAGLFRRSFAFLGDFIVIAALVVSSFQYIARPIVTSGIDDFDTLYTEFQRLEDAKSDALIDLNNQEFEARQQYNDGELTEFQYQNILDDIEADRDTVNDHYSYNNDAYIPYYEIGDWYYMFLLIYHILAFAAFHIIYVLALKGHTLGRRLMRLRLTGRINVLTLLLREFFWKYLFWAFTLGFGIIIDVYMIVLKNDNKTIRDHVSGTRVVLDEITYPF